MTASTFAFILGMAFLLGAHEARAQAPEAQGQPPTLPEVIQMPEFEDVFLTVRAKGTQPKECTFRLQNKSGFVRHR